MKFRTRRRLLIQMFEEGHMAEINIPHGSLPYEAPSSRVHGLSVMLHRFYIDCSVTSVRPLHFSSGKVSVTHAQRMACACV